MQGMSLLSEYPKVKAIHEALEQGSVNTANAHADQLLDSDAFASMRAQLAQGHYLKAILAEQQSNTKLAQLHYEKAIQFFSEHSPSLKALALIYQENKRFEEAEALLKRSLALQVRSLGEKSSISASTMAELGILYKRQNRNKEALTLLQEAFAIQTALLNQDDPVRVRSSFYLARTHQALKQYEKAEPLFRAVLAIQELEADKQPLVVAESFFQLSQKNIHTEIY